MRTATSRIEECRKKLTSLEVEMKLSEASVEQSKDDLKDLGWDGEEPVEEFLERLGKDAAEKRASMDVLLEALEASIAGFEE